MDFRRCNGGRFGLCKVRQATSMQELYRYLTLICSQRCRHAVAAAGSCLFMYGGLCGGASKPFVPFCTALTLLPTGSLLDDLVVAEDARASEDMAGDVVEPLASMADLSAPPWKVWKSTRSFLSGS